MRRFVIFTCVIAVLCLGAAGAGWAQMINNFPTSSQQEADTPCR